MNKIRVFILGTAIGLTLWSCSSLQKPISQDGQELIVGNAPNNKDISNGVFGSFHKYIHYPQVPDNMSWREYFKTVREINREEQKRTGKLPNGVRLIGELYEKHLWIPFTTWQEPHKAVSAFIEKTKADFTLIVDHQMLAVGMLQNCLFLQNPTTEVQKAIEYYVDVLQYYHNYKEYYVYSKALPMLYGYWSDEKISNTAAKIIDKSGKNEWKTSSTWPTLVEKFFRAKLPEQSTLTKSDVQHSAKIKQVKEKFWQEDLMKFPKYHKVQDIRYEMLLDITPETWAALYFMAEGKVKQ